MGLAQAQNNPLEISIYSEIPATDKEKEYEELVYNQTLYENQLAKYQELLAKYKKIRQEGTDEEIFIAYQKTLAQHKITIDAYNEYKKSLDKYLNSPTETTTETTTNDTVATQQNPNMDQQNPTMVQQNPNANSETTTNDNTVMAQKKPIRVSQIKAGSKSVTQSSNLTDNITILPIQEKEEYTIAGVKRFRWKGFHVKNGDKWIVKNLGSLKTIPCYDSCKELKPYDIGYEYRNKYLIEASGYGYFNSVNGAGIYNAGEAMPEDNQKSIAIGSNLNLFIDLKRGYTNTDYLALGYWQEGNPENTFLFPHGFHGDLGVFVDGSDPFTGSIPSLIGKATYSGPLQIKHFNTSKDFYNELTQANEQLSKIHDAFFKHNHGIARGTLYGNINLTADFGDVNSLGHIEGRIDNITAIIFPGPVPGTLSGGLNLERAAIGESHSGFFAGNVSGRLNQKQYTGQWGGQFYGNGSSHPETVAGTMAVSSEDGHIHLMAPWAADKN